jgi:hypothetical protein
MPTQTAFLGSVGHGRIEREGVVVRVRVKYVLLSAAGVAALAFMIGYRPADDSVGGRKTVIRVWQPFGGPWYEVVQATVQEFERTHPEIACRVAFMGNHISRDQKCYLSVVARSPPDVVYMPSAVPGGRIDQPPRGTAAATCGREFRRDGTTALPTAV